MTKQQQIIAFNKKYELDDLNKKWFVATTEEEFNNTKVDSISGKPKKIWKDIMKRFFTNKWNVLFLSIFLILIVFVIFGQYMTSFSASKPVSNAVPKNIAFMKPTSSTIHLTTLYTHEIASALGLASVNYIPKTTAIPFEHFTDPSGNLIPDIKYIGFDDTLGFNIEISNHYFVKTILGTDSQGYDIWTKLWASSAWSFKLAFIVAIVETVVGVSIGIYLGFNIGKSADTLLMRVIEIFSSIPALLWVSVFALIFGTSFWSLALSLIFIGWIGPVYSSRMYTAQVKEREFIYASKSLGTKTSGLLFRHILPNIFGRLTVGFVHRIPAVIFTETTLIFLGFSIGGDTSNTLGNFIQESRSLVAIDLQPLFLISGVTVLLLFAVSMQIISNGLRDAFDPKIGVK